MTIRIKAVAAVVLAAGLISPMTYAADPAPAPVAKRHKAVAKPKPAPVTAEQLEELKHEMELQINSLKDQISDRDVKLKEAQDAATAAQTAAAAAQAAANSQNQAVTDNAAAVTTLQSTVTDLKSNQVSLVGTITDDQAKVKKAIENPDVLHYKGATITPGGYMAAESVYRTHATGGDIPTAFSALPYEHADAYHLSEFYGSARQSRVSMMVQGKTNWGTLRGYVEADFLGTGISSNNNQSNSYVLRQRVVWGQAETNSHWAFTGGQLWSLATEDKKGISNLSGDILTPQTIDPNYNAGFVWTRQYGFRVTKTWDKLAIGVAAENPQFLYSQGLAGDTPYAVLGSAGANGGNYNAAVSGCTNSTYTTYTESAAGVIAPSTKYLNLCSNIANYTFNQAPDLLAKVAFDPGWGHYEVFGIARFAHETIFPGVTNNAFLYGGVTDVNGIKVNALTSAGSYNNSIALGGGGASFRVPLGKTLQLGAKGMYGSGLGRYGNTTLSDLTNKPDGEFSALHNGSLLATAEWNATPRLLVYANAGGDFVRRDNYTSTTITGATYTAATPLTPASIAYKIGNAPVGFASPLSSNSGCLTDGSPTYTSSGFNPAGSCGAATRYVKEYTVGYWYDFYKGPAGRLRQSIQYSYADRQSFGDSTGLSTRGLNNMIFTSLRYYLP